MIDEDALHQVMEVQPDADLLPVIESVVENHFPDYPFDSKKEGMFIKGGNLYYFVRPSEESDGGVHIESTIEVKGPVVIM